ncbi:MAG: response regulator [Gammaproteobacteria bacterium]|nr:response regulator [Gammaproteobacteria bacterium]
MIQLHNRSVTRALIVDDDPEARQSYEYIIEELELDPLPVDGPLDNLPAFIKTIQPSDVLLCDYHLRLHNYATCDGDELVAECYKAKVPAVLCTTIADAVLRRDCLRYIPGLIKSGNPDPSQLVDGWDRCITEMNGRFDPARRPWRTLVRVAELDNQRQLVYVIVPPWDVRQKVPIETASLPPEIREHLVPDHRFHALVNTGADNHEDLFFESWEPE